MTYFSWIANLGVEPLFLSLAFLLVPAFFSLLDRLFFVTRVRETMMNLHIFSHWQNRRFLPFMIQAVKGFTLMGLFLPSHALKSEEFQQVMLSKGEFYELPVKTLKQFSVASRDVVSAKYLVRKRQIILKGKKVGFTELKIWGGAKDPQVIPIYVLSKTSQLSLAKLVKAIQHLGLTSHFMGQFLDVKGSIEHREQYAQLKKLVESDKKRLFLSVKLSPELKKELQTEIIYDLLSSGIDDVYCEYEKIYLVCKHADSPLMSKAFIKSFKDDYFIKFIPHRSSQQSQNYSLKLKIIQVESIKKSDLNTGLNLVEGNLSELVQQPVEILYKNSVHLNDENIRFSLVAEPEIILTLNQKTEIQLGAEIPFRSRSLEGPQTEWKFAGLRSKFSLIKYGKSYQLDYSTELTSPADKGIIGGTKEQSLIKLTLNKPLKLFQISFTTEGNSKSWFPSVGNIPLLGRLFSSTSNHITHKTLVGLIILKESL